MSGNSLLCLNFSIMWLQQKPLTKMPLAYLRPLHLYPLQLPNLLDPQERQRKFI